MAKKTLKKKIIKDLEKALGDKREILEDMVIDKDYVEIPLEIANSPYYDTIENILKKHQYELSHITRYTIVYTKPRKKLAWEIQEFIEHIGLMVDR